MGEVLLIAVLALLVFGPDRLPKVAADAARTLRQIRQMASAARRELSDAAGLQDDDLTAAVRDLRDLDPRRALLGTDPARPQGSGSSVGAAAGPAGPTSPSAERPAADRPAGSAATAPTEGEPSAASAGRPTPTSGATPSGVADPPGAVPASSSGRTPQAGPVVAPRVTPQAGPVIEPAVADPDWT